MVSNASRLFLHFIYLLVYLHVCVYTYCFIVLIFSMLNSIFLFLRWHLFEIAEEMKVNTGDSLQRHPAFSPRSHGHTAASLIYTRGEKSYRNTYFVTISNQKDNNTERIPCKLDGEKFYFVPF